jgi:hypothetical protein
MKAFHPAFGGRDHSIQRAACPSLAGLRRIHLFVNNPDQYFYIDIAFPEFGCE